MYLDIAAGLFSVIVTKALYDYYVSSKRNPPKGWKKPLLDWRFHEPLKSIWPMSITPHFLKTISSKLHKLLPIMSKYLCTSLIDFAEFTTSTSLFYLIIEMFPCKMCFELPCTPEWFWTQLTGIWLCSCVLFEVTSPAWWVTKPRTTHLAHKLLLAWKQI